MAAAVEVRWPNEKDQYELQEVIGKIIMGVVVGAGLPFVTSFFKVGTVVWAGGGCVRE